MPVGAGLRTHVVGLKEDIERTVASINRRGIVVRVRASDFTQPLGKMSASASEFTKSLEASNARVIAFGASAAIIGGVSTSFAQLFIQAQKVEKILTDINVVLGTTAGNLQKFGDNLFRVARNTAQSLEVAAEAALEFSRQGLSMEETLKRTNDALILTRLTGLKAADAVKGLTAAVNGFADAGLNTTQIINKLAAVDVKFAVGADDLIDALARAGAVAQDAGVSFDQLIGSVTAAQQITARGGAVIGNSFKTIFTRIQRSSTINRLEELGVAVRDIRGNTLPAIAVLSNLSKAYDKLGDASQAAVAEQVGGVFQINILKAALKDLNKETSLYSQATKISSMATDEAQRKNEELQKTLAAISNQSFTNLRELTANLGELSVAPALKEFLKTFNSISETINKLFSSQEGESLGGDFAKGFARALGSVLTGPGLMLSVLVFGKLFTMAFKFAKASVKDILQIKSIKEQELAIQESIVSAMVENVALQKELFKLDGNQAKQEELILSLLQKQTAQIEKQRQIAQAVAPGLRMAGVNPNLTVGSKNQKSKTRAEGFVPNFESKNAGNNYGAPTPLEKQRERAGAIKAGYTPGSIKSMNLSGVGKVVYNDAETVKSFAGMKQPAIMPPSGSRAGLRYKTAFQTKHGFDPYSEKDILGSSNNQSYSSGFMPNFANKPMAVKAAIMQTLKKRGVRLKPNDPSLDFRVQKYLSATKDRDFPGGFISIGGHKINMNEITLALKKQGDYHKSFNDSNPVNLKGSANNDTYNTGFVPNFALAAERIAGTNILRLPTAKMVTQTTQSDYRRNRVKGWRTLEAPLDNVVKSAQSYREQFDALKALGINVLQRKMYFGDQPENVSVKDRKMLGHRSTNVRGDTYEGILHKSGLGKKGYTRSYDPSSNIGSKNAKVDFVKAGRVPLEAKFGKFVAANLIAKSIRLFSDNYIEKFLSSKRFSGLAQQMSSKKLQDSQNILSTLGYENPSEDLVRTMGLAGGFIPNFAVKKIANVIDGDSIEADVFVGTQKIDHRLKGVDAVEKNQAFGTRAQTLAKARYQNNKAGRDLLDKNRISGGSAAYNRGLFADQQLAKDLVLKGYGIPDIGYLSKGEYESYVRDVNVARKAKRGIWGRNHFKQNKKTGQITYLHPKAQMFLSQYDFSKNNKWKDITVRDTRFKGANKATYGYASGKGSKGKNTYAGGFMPNYAMADAMRSYQSRKSSKLSKDQFNATSAALTNFNAGNALFARTALSGASRIKLTERNFDKIRQFINSKEFRQLDSLTKNKILVDLKSQSKSLGLSDVTRGYAQHSNPLFEGRIAASNGLIPNFKYWKKHVQFAKGADGGWGIKGETTHLHGLVDYLEKSGGYSKKEINKLKAQLKNVRDRRYKEIQDLGYPSMGREGAKHYARRRAISARSESLSLKGVFLKDLKQAIHKYNDIENSRMFSGGLIPNFSNPLQDAIQREANAGVPKSLIRVDQDNSLRSKQNPMGLAVTNTRDEPNGIKQGINRAKQMGIDPKSHGSSSVFLPNFNNKSIVREPMRPKLDQAAKEAETGIDGLMTKMFGLTTVAYALEGAMGEAESGMAQFFKVANAGVMGLAQGSMILDLGKGTGQNMMAKGAAQAAQGGALNMIKGGGTTALGGLLRMIGPVGFAFAALTPIISALKENTDFLDSSLDSLNKASSKTEKALDALSSSINAATSLKETENEMIELSNSSQGKTLEGEKRMIDLQIKSSTQRRELLSTSKQLAKYLDKGGKEIELMTSGTAEGMKALQKAQLEYAQKLEGIEIAKGFSGEAIRKQNIGGTLMDIAFSDLSLPSIFTNVRRIGELTGIADQTDLTSKIDPLARSASQVTAARSLSSNPEQAEIAMKTLEGVNLKQLKSSGEGSLGQKIENLLKSDDSNKQAVGLKLQPLISAAQDQTEFLQKKRVEDLKEINDLLEKYKKVQEKNLKESEGEIKLFQEIKKAREATLLSIQRSRDFFDIDQNLAAESNNINQQRIRNQQELNNAIGITTKDAKINAAIQEKIYKSQFEYGQKREKVEQEALNKLQDLNKKLFGTSDKSSTVFSNLTSKTDSAKSGSPEALKENAEKIAKSIAPLDKILAENLKQANNAEQARQITFEYLSKLKDQAKVQEILTALVTNGSIPSEKNITNTLEDINLRLSKRLDAISESEKNTLDQLGYERLLTQIQEGSLSGNKRKLQAINESADFAADIAALENYNYENTLTETEIKLKQLKAQLENLKTSKGMTLALQASYSTQMLTLSEQQKALAIETALVNDKQKLSALVKKQVDIEEQNAVNARKKAAETFKEKYSRNFFGKEAQRGRAANIEQMAGQQQATAQLMKDYASEGNAVRFSEETLKYAEQQKELNIEQNKGTLFADSLAVKIAEANVEIARFGETMANTTFDAVKDGFKGFVDDMLSGTKSLGDAALGFAHGIISKVHEQLVNRAVNQITTGLFESMGYGVGATSKQGGGIISRYSTGGSVGGVPAMLTNGEYVVKKKIVDKLGVADLNKINQTGSLEDLYNEPNEKSFELMNGGGLAMPPIIRLREGGSLDNYLAKRDQSGDSGSQNERSVIDGEIVNTLSNTIAKFAGGLLRMNNGGSPKMKDGGFVDGLKNSLRSDPSDSAGMKMAKGSGYLAGTLAAGYKEYKPQAYSGSAPVKVGPLNTRSMLNLDRYGDSMSARFRAQDDYSSRYGDYLLDKYQHDVNQRNQKYQSRANMLQGMVNQVGMMGIMYGTEKAVSAAFNRDKPAVNQTSNKKDYYTNITNSQANAYRDYQINQQAKSNAFLNNNTSISQDNISSAYSIGGGNLFSNQDQFIKRNSYGMSEGGRVQGPAGIDKVGPVLLDRGEFVIKASSVNKVEKQYPGFFDRLNSMKFNEGGVVDPSASNISQTSETTNNQSNSSNVTVNINVSSGGQATVEGGGASDQAFAAKIKEAVVNVISQEKRVGGMLR